MLPNPPSSDGPKKYTMVTSPAGPQNNTFTFFSSMRLNANGNDNTAYVHLMEYKQRGGRLDLLDK